MRCAAILNAVLAAVSAALPAKREARCSSSRRPRSSALRHQDRVPCDRPDAASHHRGRHAVARAHHRRAPRLSAAPELVEDAVDKPV